MSVVILCILEALASNLSLESACCKVNVLVVFPVLPGK
jgi:hypothetical protein